MFAYIKGIVTETNSNSIILENQKIGYLIYVSNPYSFKLNEEITIYLYQYIREDENTLYGFKMKEEKDLFLRLIEVKGLGCKMALPMFSSGTTAGIIDAIEKENILYLKKFPKIGDKIARQIILDLKGKLVSNKGDVIQNEELTETLLALGYKKDNIKRVISNVDSSKKIEDQIKDALRLLLK